MGEEKQPLRVRLLASLLNIGRHLDFTGTFHLALQHTEPFLQLHKKFEGKSTPPPADNGGTQTKAIDHLVNGVLYYLDGDFQGSERHFSQAFADESPYIIIAGRNKRISIFDDQTRRRIQDLFEFLHGTPVEYRVAPEKVRMYEQVTDMLKADGLAYLPMLKGLKNIVVTMQTDAPSAEQFAHAYPATSERILQGCVDAAGWMHNRVFPITTNDYACIPKLHEVLAGIDGPLEQAGRDAIGAYGNYFAHNTRTGFWDRCLSNHFIRIPAGVMAYEHSLMLVNDDGAFKDSFVITDFETCTDRTTVGHGIADICFKTDVELSDDAMRHVRTELCRQAGVPFNRARELEEVVRLYRDLQYRSDFRSYMGRATKRISAFFDAAIEPTPEGWKTAWNTHAAVIQRAMR